MSNVVKDPRLREALTRIFGDIGVAEGLLGVDAPHEQTETPFRAPEQAARLVAKIESYLKDMARELEELGPDEARRLRAEATGLLVALREIRTHFSLDDN